MRITGDDFGCKDVHEELKVNSFSIAFVEHSKWT
jgi:hypothetical protein